MNKGITEILPLVQGLSKSRPAFGISWSFPDDWKLDVGDPAFMSSKKAGKKKEVRGCAGRRAFIGQTWATCLVPLKGAERLPQPLVRVCDGHNKGSVTGHSAESSSLSSLGGWETRWGKRQWAETQRNRVELSLSTSCVRLRKIIIFMSLPNCIVCNIDGPF